MRGVSLISFFENIGIVMLEEAPTFHRLLAAVNMEGKTDMAVLVWKRTHWDVGVLSTAARQLVIEHASKK